MEEVIEAAVPSIASRVWSPEFKDTAFSNISGFANIRTEELLTMPPSETEDTLDQTKVATQH